MQSDPQINGGFSIFPKKRIAPAPAPLKVHELLLLTHNKGYPEEYKPYKRIFKIRHPNIELIFQFIGLGDVILNLNYNELQN